MATVTNNINDNIKGRLISIRKYVLYAVIYNWLNRGKTINELNDFQIGKSTLGEEIFKITHSGKIVDIKPDVETVFNNDKTAVVNFVGIFWVFNFFNLILSLIENIPKAFAYLYAFGFNSFNIYLAGGKCMQYGKGESVSNDEFINTLKPILKDNNDERIKSLLAKDDDKDILTNYLVAFYLFINNKLK